jgi:metal-responsive CopG/Arc/MetJ family transcriptional regulator
MRAPRTLVPIPQRLVAGIDKIIGSKHRARFVAEVLETELLRREQMAALEEAAGCWKDENHPELANVSEAFIRELRNQSVQRLEELDRQRS